MTSLVCLMICLTSPQVSSATTDLMQISSGQVVFQDKNYNVGSGWYVTDKKMTAIANGANKLKAQVKQLTIERDAYKEAYDKLSTEHENLKVTYTKLFDYHEQYKVETTNLMKNYEDQINFYQKENKKLRANRAVYKWTTIGLSVLGIAHACSH